VSEFTHQVDASSTTHELELIHQKKTALQRLVKLTANLNTLSQGLQSTLLMGKPARSIPNAIVKSFKAMTSRLNPLPTNKLQNYLTATQIKLQGDIRHVLQLTQKQESEIEEYLTTNTPGFMGNLEENFTDYVNDFKKKGQVSIALRIVLAGRNALSSVFKLPVPENFIKKQIKTLDKREAKYKKRIKTELTGLFKEITALIDSNTIPEELIPQLHHTRGQILNNINHFNAGKNIQDMPIMFENIEISTSALPAEAETGSSEKPGTMPEPVDEVMAEIEEIEIKPVKRSLKVKMKELVTPRRNKTDED